MSAPGSFTAISLAAFALSYALVVISPGPNLLVVSHAALTGSRGAALKTAAGVGLGASLLAWLAFSGAVAIGPDSPLRSAMLATFAAVLAAFGLRTLWRMGRPPAPAHPAHSCFAAGFLTALLNPGTAMFLSLNAMQRSQIAERFAMTAIVFVIALGWFCAVAICINSAAGRRCYDRCRQTLSAATGVMFIVLAVVSLQRALAG